LVAILVQVAVALGTIALAVVAFFQGCESKEEMEQMRFADNLPVLIVGACRDNEGKPTWSIANVGKGPATLVCFGFDPPAGDDHRWPAGNREYLGSGILIPCHVENRERLAAKYKAYKAGWIEKPAQDEKAQYYVQYADIFLNEYRQYFFVNDEGEFVAPGRFMQIRADDKERYVPVRYTPD
jgi:hypothetical protein